MSTSLDMVIVLSYEEESNSRVVYMIKSSVTIAITTITLFTLAI